MKASSAEAADAGLAPQAGLALHVRVASGFFAKARGLIGRPRPLPGCALLMRGVTLVHGFGMTYPIDLVFLDAGDVVVACRRLLPAGVAACRGARHVLEMQAGEIARLRLRPGLRLRLVPVAAIFAAPLRAILLAAAVFACVAGHKVSQAAPPNPAGGASATVLAPLDLAQPLAVRTLQRLESEAEMRYRMGPPERGRDGANMPGDDAELIRMYQSLAEVAADRSPQAWLRIGNIHQRAGSVGAAIDAYRRLLEAIPHAGARAAEAAAAERKALLNLAGLALEQAGKAVSKLEALGGPAAVTAPHAGALQTLQDRLLRQHAPTQNPGVAATDRGDGVPLASPPGTVERYTASARRNAVKAARGSLHLDPADGLPASQVTKARPRRGQEALPKVEYLLGDPNRSKAAAPAEASATAGGDRRGRARPGRREEGG